MLTKSFIASPPRFNIHPQQPGRTLADWTAVRYGAGFLAVFKVWSVVRVFLCPVLDGVNQRRYPGPRSVMTLELQKTILQRLRLVGQLCAKIVDL